jgi:hypothetical protein
MNLHSVVQKALFENRDLNEDSNLAEVLSQLPDLCKRAFVEKNEDALLAAHRVLYVINMAKLSQPWIKPAYNVDHPKMVQIKFDIEEAWERSERQKNKLLLDRLPGVKGFVGWITDFVSKHESNGIHPIFYYLRDQANFKEMRYFTLQETPLEMLFGDIVALMMPGVYGGIKVELVKNFWDEVGHADDAKVHRNLRGNLMCQLDIEPDFYQTDVEFFVREELTLVNMYLAMGMNRSKLTQLVGVMLATELVIPGRFQYLIDGWRRLGLKEEALIYHTESPR